jgi:hypothetical protein
MKLDFLACSMAAAAFAGLQQVFEMKGFALVD